MNPPELLPVANMVILITGFGWIYLRAPAWSGINLDARVRNLERATETITLRLDNVEHNQRALGAEQHNDMESLLERMRRLEDNLERMGGMIRELDRTMRVVGCDHPDCPRHAK